MANLTIHYNQMGLDYLIPVTKTIGEYSGKEYFKVHLPQFEINIIEEKFSDLKQNVIDSLTWILHQEKVKDILRGN